VITDRATQNRLLQSFPFLQQADEPFTARFMRMANLTKLDKGNHICHEGLECTHLALVLSGTARVYKLGENGREITLYRVNAGESCILTASCILSTQPFPAFAVSETPIEAALIPAAAVKQWLADSAQWREYLFGLVAQRLANVINVIEEVVFKRMDRRIAEYLIQRSANQPHAIQATHQEIASDLGTSREVVSRILKDLESKALIHVTRGAVEVLNTQGLEEKIEQA